VLRFRLMVKRGRRLRPQASEGEAQHGPFCWTRRFGQGDERLFRGQALSDYPPIQAAKLQADRAKAMAEFTRLRQAAATPQARQLEAIKEEAAQLYERSKHASPAEQAQIEQRARQLLQQLPHMGWLKPLPSNPSGRNEAIGWVKWWKRRLAPLSQTAL